jgi:hypothetical protein
MSGFAKNHMASRFYLAGFAGQDGKVEVISVGGQPSVRLAKPENVGYRRKFWGQDEALRERAESMLGNIEDEAALKLLDLPSSWPPPARVEDRAVMMQFLAIHLLRTPGWKRLRVRLGERLVEEQGDDYPGEISRDEMFAVTRSDEFVVEGMFSEIPKLASLFGCMHWSLVHFTSPCLATGDQPVVAVPFVPGGSEEVAPMPSAGLLHSVEFRIAIDPNNLLVLSWVDADDAARPLSGTTAIAAEANRSVRAQADRQWFRYPGASTPLGAVLLGRAAKPMSVSGDLLPPYSLDHALRSRRRREAERHVHDMIAGDVTDELRSVMVRRRTDSRAA